MTNIINYTAWFNIFALAFNLINDPVLREGIVVRPRWGNIDEVGLVSPEGGQAMFIDIYSRDEILILSYVMIPWYDMTEMQLEPGMKMKTSFPDYKLYTVTPFAVIYLVEPHNDQPQGLTDGIKEQADKLFSYEECETLIQAEDGFSSKDGLQVMYLNEYQSYVDIQAAIPGSRNIDGREFLNKCPSKMIRMSLIPESGNIRIHWLAPDENLFPGEFLKAEDLLSRAFMDGMKKCLESPDDKERILMHVKDEVDEKLSKAGLSCDNIPEYCSELPDRLFFYEPSLLLPNNPEHPFNDYVPKMSPDELLNFMPELAPKINALPEAKLENLHLLVRMFREYKKSARKKHGEWREGNMVLGARPEEYYPSEEELILSELGERIRFIATEEGSTRVKSTLKEQKSGKKKFKYNRFSFIHMDVMGSGRFFYVDSIEKMNLKLY